MRIMKACSLLSLLLFFLLVTSPFLAQCEEEGGDDSSSVKHPSKNVVERKLVVEKPNTKLIVKDHKNYALDTSKKNFKGETLAYVTPWNNHGYDVAKIFNKKFTYVSPVWIQVKIGERMQLGGLHDIDAGWIADVRRGSNTKIVPRVIFEGINSIQIAQYAFSKGTEIIKLVVDMCVKHKFDGIVLEGLAATLPAAEEEAQEFINNLANALHEKNMKIIFVVPPDVRVFGAEKFATYSKFVDRFSLMTYDHSNPEKPGPLAPLEWVEKSAEILQVGDNANKIMLGLNFYGFDFIPSEGKGNAIVGETYIQLLKVQKPKLTWESNSAEHVFTYKENSKTHQVYYPTLKSVHERIKLAERLGVSIAIWEIGQGLDYFYDLL